jgi:hypothetical protein
LPSLRVAPDPLSLPLVLCSAMGAPPFEYPSKT